MNFGLNKITGTDRQTVEQIKNRLLTPSRYKEIPIDSLEKYTDSSSVNWYKIPTTEDTYFQGVAPGLLTLWNDLDEDPSIEPNIYLVNMNPAEDGYDMDTIFCHFENVPTIYATDGTYVVASAVYSVYDESGSYPRSGGYIGDAVWFSFSKKIGNIYQNLRFTIYAKK